MSYVPGVAERSVPNEEYNLNINGFRINHLRFVDDLILIEEDPNKLQGVVQKLAIRSKEVGLKINKSVMTNSIEVEIKLDGNSLEYVSEYVYLEQIIAPNDQMSKKINKRIASG
ncbi:Putative uncharacterized transposon-derived protein F52C9.6 [Eumeta japonica]|uniref:Uncharacterized transposon-derived protein F52C9.6 n=1 Tax=Eumeta variegata TaxID=151549 RepID=A0A4C1UE51_EUMVA|nr:Putative uncharacterized transposon-derived protein F52C9.6 [Eumeta japonica]